MTDKEVGKLWKGLTTIPPADLRGELFQEICADLIIKLVDERAERYADPSVGESGFSYALRDFSISKSKWHDWEKGR